MLFVILQLLQRAQRAHHTHSRYIAPQNTPVTSFCTNLTGITDETLANGTTLAAAVARIDAYAVELAAAGKTFCLVAHGTLRAPLHRTAVGGGA